MRSVIDWKEIDILTEEPSMDVFLRSFLPRVLPEEWIIDKNLFIRPHQGKQDLMKSIPIKLRASRKLSYPKGFIILHDQDSNDCIQLKNNIVESRLSQNTNAHFFVRIVCKELENWYLGDMTAIEILEPTCKAISLQTKAKYRNVDLLNGSQEVESLLKKDFSKMSVARSIGPILDENTNTSRSFQVFISGLRKFFSSF